MPSYNFKNIVTGEEFSIHLKMSERESFLAENPDLKQVLAITPSISGRGRGRPDDGFRDVLKEIKKKHSGGFTKSNINTF